MLFKDTREALEFWSRVERGDIDQATLELLQHVACEITQTVFHAEFKEGANRRAEAALKAIGWTGRMAKYPDADWMLDAGFKPRELAIGYDLLGHTPPDYDPAKALKTFEAKTARKKKRESE